MVTNLFTPQELKEAENVLYSEFPNLQKSIAVETSYKATKRRLPSIDLSILTGMATVLGILILIFAWNYLLAMGIAYVISSFVKELRYSELVMPAYVAVWVWQLMTFKIRSDYK